MDYPGKFPENSRFTQDKNSHVHRMGLRPRLIALPPLQATLESQCLNQWDSINKSQGQKLNFLKYPLVNIQTNYGKSPFLVGKSTISMAMFNSKLLVYRRIFKKHQPIFMNSIL